MLKFSILVLFLFGSAAQAQNQAQNLCTEVACNDKQTEIQKAFDDLPQFSPHTAGGVYSGVCYHSWPGLDPARAQFVMSVVERDAKATTLNSVFNFFSANDPYAKLDLAQAKKELEHDSCKAAPVEVTADLAYELIKSDKGTIEYWVHSDADEFYLLGAWKLESGQVHSWCHLTRNH